jgi:hypothetical protein
VGGFCIYDYKYMSIPPGLRHRSQPCCCLLSSSLTHAHTLLVLASQRLSRQISKYLTAHTAVASTRLSTMAARIHRVTMFKIPSVENQKKLIEAYKTLSQNQKKVCACARLV